MRNVLVVLLVVLMITVLVSVTVATSVTPINRSYTITPTGKNKSNKNIYTLTYTWEPARSQDGKTVYTKYGIYVRGCPIATDPPHIVTGQNGYGVVVTGAPYSIQATGCRCDTNGEVRLWTYVSSPTVLYDRAMTADKAGCR